MGYWGKVFKGAWAKTWQPLGWDRKKVATAILGAVGVVVVGIHLGWLAMIASGPGIFWAALPIVVTAILLFAWGFFETQAELYEQASAKIAQLEAAIAASKDPPPDYESYRHVERLTLRIAAFLWAETSPGSSMSKPVQARYAMLCGAIQSGDLKFVPQLRDTYLREVRIRMQQENPRLDTIVKRTDLKQFAAKHSLDPIFLRDA